MERTNNTRGITVVEVMVGLMLFLLIFVFIYQTITIFFQSQARVLPSFQALYLAQEGQEMLRFLRDDDWDTLDSLTRNASYGFDVSSTTVAVDGSPEVIDGVFTRRFIIQNAYRTGSDDFVASTTPGASIDPDSLLGIVIVEWGDEESLVLHGLLTDLHNQ